MKKNIKCLLLASFAFGLSAPIFANTCNPFAVTVPNQQGGFTIGADALYLQPTTQDREYTFQITGDTTSNLAFISPDPNYRWGFDVTAGYRIPCTGNDITASWTHLSKKSDATTTTIPTFQLSIAGGAGTETLNITGRSGLQLEYDAFDLDVGQRINFGDNFQYRLFTGVRWAKLAQNKSIDVNANALISITGTDINLLVNDSTHDDGSFHGLGPQIGMGGRYCLGYGFGLDGNLITSLLVGRAGASVTNSQSRISDTPAIIDNANTNTNVHVSSKARVVPAVDVSLGLDYTYNFNNCDRSNVVIQGGWRAINYWNAIQRYTNAGIQANFSNGGRLNFSTSLGFQGPYVGITANL